MTIATTTLGVEALIAATRVLNTLADDRSTYDDAGREHQDFSALAATVLMRDLEAMGEPATLPEPAAIERMEEQLQRLFAAAHIVSRVFTSLAD
jgi:hypothetical protein